MYRLTLISILFIASHSFAQKKGFNRIAFCYTPQMFYFINNIKYDGVPSAQHIHSNNTKGHYYAIQYQRVTRYGLMIAAGLHYGIRRYDINIAQDLSGFDPEAAVNLNGFTFRQQVKVNVNYCGPKISLGYRLPISKEWAIAARAGWAVQLFFDGDWRSTRASIEYLTDDGLKMKTAEINYMERKFGRQGVSNPRGKFYTARYFPNKNSTLEYYLGVDRTLNLPWFKTISLGIEVNDCLYPIDNVGSMMVWSSPTINQFGESRAAFNDRYLSIGLRVAVGLWK